MAVNTRKNSCHHSKFGILCHISAVRGREFVPYWSPCLWRQSTQNLTDLLLSHNFIQIYPPLFNLSWKWTKNKKNKSNQKHKLFLLVKVTVNVTKRHCNDCLLNTDKKTILIFNGSKFISARTFVITSFQCCDTVGWARRKSLRARCTSLTKWLTRELTIWLSVDALHETLTLG